MKREVCVGTFASDADAIWQKYLDDRRLRQFSFEHPPETRNRCPVTQEFMVAAIVAERNGEAPPHPAKQFFADSLLVSIDRMVGMLAARYSITCVDPEEDLSQECFLRIWMKLHKFDPKKAKFTTWAWTVCTRVLNREYRRSQKLKDHISVQPDESMERKAVTVDGGHAESMLTLEFSQAVKELGDKYPKWREFVYELLGKPGVGTITGEVCVAHAALAVGLGRGPAMDFYHRRVQPFFRKKFREEEVE